MHEKILVTQVLKNNDYSHYIDVGLCFSTIAENNDYVPFYKAKRSKFLFMNLFPFRSQDFW